MTPKTLSCSNSYRKVVFRLIQDGPDPLYRRTCYEFRRSRWHRVRRDLEPWSLSVILQAQPPYYSEITSF